MTWLEWLTSVLVGIGLAILIILAINRFLPIRNGQPVQADPLPLLPADFTPNWERILHSEVWKNDLVPMLELMRQECLFRLMKANPEEVKSLQGMAMAYHKMLTAPIQSASMDQYLEAERKKFEEIETDGPRRDPVSERYNPERRRRINNPGG